MLGPSLAPLRAYPHARSGRAALRALTALVALVHCLEDGTLRLRLCYKNQALLEALRQDVAAAFTALAGIVAGHASGSPQSLLSLVTLLQTLPSPSKALR